MVKDTPFIRGFMLLVLQDKDPIFDQPGFNMGAGEILHIPKPTRIYMSSQEGQFFFVFCWYKQNLKNQPPKINNRKKTKQKVTTTKNNEK